MTINEVAYKIYEYRIKVGFDHPQVRDYEYYDIEHAILYLQFDRTESVEEFMSKFIGE